MISREDMLELTGRMTLSRTSFTRTAGCYVDRDGGFDGSFNINFLKLSASERMKKLKLAKKTPFAVTNANLKKYEYLQGARKLGSMWQLFMAMNECSLKNSAPTDISYDVVMEYYRVERKYAIPAFYDCYDTPAKGFDKERQWESEGVLEYMIRVVRPLSEEHEPDKPVCGSLLPVFTDRSGDLNYTDVFQADVGRPHNEILKPLEIA